MPDRPIIFVLRIWIEPGTATASSRIRGSLQRIDTGEMRYFSSCDAIGRVVCEALERPTIDQSDDTQGGT